jgi:hypothetical protein
MWFYGCSSCWRTCTSETEEKPCMSTKSYACVSIPWSMGNLNMATSCRGGECVHTSSKWGPLSLGRKCWQSNINITVMIWQVFSFVTQICIIFILYSKWYMLVVGPKSWTSEMKDFHGSDYEEWCLLGCYTVLLLYEPMFQRNLVPPSSGWQESVN